MNRTESDIRPLLGSSASMRELAHQVEAVAAGDQTVLLVGEAGVGKSRVARVMHALSARAPRPFQSVQCGFRPERALEEELFGNEGTPDGSFQSAAGGTVYLEEIADLPGSLQPTLLTLLDAGVLRDRAVDVRLIASSEKDLATEVTEQRFNEALYYRLGVTPLHLPPLRARSPEDLRSIATALHGELRRGLPDAPREMSDRSMDVITRYHWPANIRELRNVLERALLQARGAARVDLVHLPAEILEASADIAHTHVSRTLADVERTHIERTLRAHGANRTRAARDLGISRATLIKKIREYGLADRHPGGRSAGTEESA
jgi:DNA-binding NtrC family response regulator